MFALKLDCIIPFLEYQAECLCPQNQCAGKNSLPCNIYVQFGSKVTSQFPMVSMCSKPYGSIIELESCLISRKIIVVYQLKYVMCHRFHWWHCSIIKKRESPLKWHYLSLDLSFQNGSKIVLQRLVSYWNNISKSVSDSNIA